MIKVNKKRCRYPMSLGVISRDKVEGCLGTQIADHLGLAMTVDFSQ